MYMNMDNLNGKKIFIFLFLAFISLKSNGQSQTVSDLTVVNDPGNNTTNSLTPINLINRGQGGIGHRWSLYTAAIGGGWGVRPNAFELWEYPASPGDNCCRPRLSVLPSATSQSFKTMFISGAGNLGIGKEPENGFTIDVIGNIRNSNGGFSSEGNLAIGTTWVDNAQGWNKVIDLFGGVHAKMLVRSDNVKTGIFSHDAWKGRVGRIGTESFHDLRLIVGYENEVMSLTTAGNVGIGIDNPTEKLSVNGNIRAKKLIVTQNGWPDYVFSKSYHLMPLDKLEAFVQRNSHLPEIPSAAEVESKGLDMGKTQALLLKKIEEMTLYIIQLKKENKNQDIMIKEMQKLIMQINRK